MIYVANALHVPNTLDPSDLSHPQWDTMWALRNTSDQPVTARIQLRRDDGRIVPWPDGADHYDQILQPGRMWAASFIPDNGFSAFPIDWRGGATIDLQRQSPFGTVDATSDVIPFFLLAFNGWHNGINVPFKRSVPPRPFGLAQLWRFAYAIPYFDDSAGATERKWTTGVEINNQGATGSSGHLTYTVAQTYGPYSGKQYTLPFTVGPYEKKRFDLYAGNPDEKQAGLTDAGYPTGFNSEGHVDIVTDAQVLLQPSMIIADIGSPDKPYDFTVTEESDL